MRKRITPALAAALAVLACGPALAEVEPTSIPVTTDAAALQSGTYAMDPSHTEITFWVSHMGVSNYTGRFNKAAGTLQFDAADPTQSTLEVTIDTASIDVNHQKLTPELAGEKHLNASAYPAITFKATKIEKTSPTTGRVTGDFTMLGVTKPVTLDVTFNGKITHPMRNMDVMGFSAKGVLKRTDWGYTALTQVVGADVTFGIETEFHKAQ
ncbi:MAG: YceI family protein [Alphaproteobacteria bacterium]|nr:YceI family protein [Alphaproteobacteria bacterium]